MAKMSLEESRAERRRRMLEDSVLKILPVLAIPMIISMAVAFFDIHDALFPEGELSLIYFIVFIILFFTGPGRYSIDYLLDMRFNKLKGEKS